MISIEKLPYLWKFCSDRVRDIKQDLHYVRVDFDSLSGEAY